MPKKKSVEKVIVKEKDHSDIMEQVIQNTDAKIKSKDAAIEVPTGWKLLPKGPVRRIRVNRDSLMRTDAYGNPTPGLFIQILQGGATVLLCYEIKILGACSLVSRNEMGSCSVTVSAAIETDGDILCRVS